MRDRYVLADVTPLRLDANRLARILSTSHGYAISDTDLVSAESFRTAFTDAELDGDMISDYYEALRKVCLMYRYTCACVSNSTSIALKYVHADDLPLLEPLIQDVYAGRRESFRLPEYRLVDRPSGRMIWCSGHWRAFNRQPDGRPQYVTAVKMNITPLVRAREENRQTKERLRRLLDEVPIGVWEGNERGEMIWANKAHLEICEGTPEQMYGYG